MVRVRAEGHRYVMYVTRQALSQNMVIALACNASTYAGPIMNMFTSQIVVRQSYAIVS